MSCGARVCIVLASFLRVNFSWIFEATEARAIETVEIYLITVQYSEIPRNRYMNWYNWSSQLYAQLEQFLGVSQLPTLCVMCDDQSRLHIETILLTCTFLRFDRLLHPWSALSGWLNVRNMKWLNNVATCCAEMLCHAVVPPKLVQRLTVPQYKLIHSADNFYHGAVWWQWIKQSYMLC